MSKEIKEGKKNSLQLTESLAQQQKELTLSIQNSQKENSESLVLALTSLTEALRELKSKDD